MTDPTGRVTRMHVEAAEAGEAVERMLAANAPAFAALSALFRHRRPEFLVTCARGSSGHAATYAKYLIETQLGIPVVSAAPSVASVFNAPVASGRHIICLVISQSGRSPDLLASMEAHRRGGAHIVALVNDEASPLALHADTVIALKAGPEHSVAATKSCLAAMAAVAAIVAEAVRNPALIAGVAELPLALPRAFERDWRAMAQALTSTSNLFVIGRGFGFGVAQEMALKLKETCAMHAEAFSAAEVRHGPMAIVGPGFPLLVLAGSDAAGQSARAVAAELAARGAQVLLADPNGHGVLPMEAADPAIEPLLALASFYRAANTLSLARGLDPDAPPHLAKVTRTM